MDRAIPAASPPAPMHEEHTDADGVRYVSGRRPVPHEAATR